MAASCLSNNNRIKVTTLHVSCNSDPVKNYDKGEDLAGIVLYSKDGKNDWYWNGIHCKTGYIIIKKNREY